MNSTAIHTDCYIVGGRPAGVISSLLLARKGISVMLLEAHKDFGVAQLWDDAVLAV